MADNIDITEALVENGSQGGTEELQNFSEKTLADYRQRFNIHKKNLEYYINNGQMTRFIGSNKSEPYVKTIMEKMKELEGMKEAISHYSIKGGAYIVDKEKFDDFITKIKNIYNQRGKKEGQEDIVKLNDMYIFQKILLEVSRDVYKLKAEITGVNEQFAFIYRGSNGTIQTITVPMDFFFKSVLGLDIDLGLFDITYDKSKKSSSFGLRFNKSAMTSILSQFQGDEIKEINGMNASTFYDIEKSIIEEKSILGSKLTQKEKDNLSLTEEIIREDKYYWVWRNKFQTGFIAQHMLESFLTGEKYNYTQDTVDWWKGSDIEIDTEQGKYGYSVKSFLESAPSFVNLSSCLKAVNKILNVLNNKKLDFKAIKEQLKTSIWSTAKKIGTFAEQNIEKDVTSSLTG